MWESHRWHSYQSRRTWHLPFQGRRNHLDVVYAGSRKSSHYHKCCVLQRQQQSTPSYWGQTSSIGCPECFPSWIYPGFQSRANLDVFIRQQANHTFKLSVRERSRRWRMVACASRQSRCQLAPCHRRSQGLGRLRHIRICIVESDFQHCLFDVAESVVGVIVHDRFFHYVHLGSNHLLDFFISGDRSKWLVATYEAISDGERPFIQKPRPVMKSSRSATSCRLYLFCNMSTAGSRLILVMHRHSSVVVGRRASYLLVRSCLSFNACKNHSVIRVIDTTSWTTRCSRHNCFVHLTANEFLLLPSQLPGGLIRSGHSKRGAWRSERVLTQTRLLP